MTASFRDRGLSRRELLTSVAAGGAALLLGPRRARGAAKYTRYNATSAQGKAMLNSYAKAIEKMLALPPTHPHNWFRNAFVHTLDCPHGNWWFFAWHRGYLGYFEQTIRALSENQSFAMPYWDWTQLPEIPATMFEGVLTPTSAAFDPYIKSYQTFFDSMNPVLTTFWNNRTPGQVAQLNLRQFPTLDAVWDQVKNNPMYATTPNARYLSAQNPKLDARTAAMCAPPTIIDGLKPTTFIPFNSNRTASHTVPPTGSTTFSVLEGLPHNNVHNNIGGVNHVPQSDFGYMQDNLSPTDPVFFLHHSNMDRLWQVWIRKQERLGLPTLPEVPADRKAWEEDPFLFFIDAEGKPVTAKAGDYATIGAFDYDYEPGLGEEVVAQAAPPSPPAQARFSGKLKGAVGSVSVGSALLNQAAAGQPGRTLVARVTLPHPSGPNAPRTFDVLVNAPANVTSAGPDSPYYAGTISFFGAMRGMTMDATFAVPLTKVLANLKSGNKLGAGELQIRVVPQGVVRTGLTAAPASPARVKAVAVEVW
jgi:tyrosinase